MDPVWMLFWGLLLLFAGFFVGWLMPERARACWQRSYELWQQQKLGDGQWRLIGPWHEFTRDVVFGLAVLTGMLGIGFGCGALLGNPWGALTAMTFSFAAGLAWGASQWLPKRVPVSWIQGNHWRSPCETWDERLARWGFPSVRQMKLAVFRSDLRERLDRSGREAEEAERRNLLGFLSSR